MPRYHFDLYNSVGCTRDEDGQDAPDLHHARSLAVDGIRSILGDEVRGGRLDLNGRIDIRDGVGGVLMRVPFAEAVEVLAAEPASS